MSAETSVRAAATVYLQALANGQAANAHRELVALEVSGGEMKNDPDVGQEVGKIVSVILLEVGNSCSTAVVQAKWPARAGWLTLLSERGEWQVISAVTSTATGQVKPNDFAEAMSACWGDYCGANRVCDGERMAKVFHSKCRLTYTGPDGEVIIKPQDEFCRMVSDRYTLPLHAPYAHLQFDARAWAQDTLISITFATPDVCMVVLKVGHPPMLWTDVLTCAHLGDKWWIVAKSSCSEPLLADEKEDVNVS